MDECPLYSEPELYDRLFPRASDSAAVLDEVRRQRTLASERFYLEEAARGGGRVLELACGSGRLTIPIAQSGFEVAGIDLSETMLDAARTKARAARAQVQLLRADMRSFDLPGEFSTIIIPGNSLLHLLTIDDLRQCLACASRHLSPGGRIIFDISKWDLRLLAGDSAHRHPVLRLNDAARGEIIIEETASYDSAAQIRDIVWYLSAPGAPDFRVIGHRLRVIFPQELLLLLESADLRLEARYGEFTREPFESSSPRQVCICVKGPDSGNKRRRPASKPQCRPGWIPFYKTCATFYAG